MDKNLYYVGVVAFALWCVQFIIIIIIIKCIYLKYVLLLCIVYVLYAVVYLLIVSSYHCSLFDISLFLITMEFKYNALSFNIFWNQQSWPKKLLRQSTWFCFDFLILHFSL